MEGDGDPAVLHVGAYDAAGRLVACGNTRPDLPPFPCAQSDAAWRVRGMATADDVRGRGAGAAVLAALLGLSRERGGRLLWCNARTPAQAFYERAGLRTWGEPWLDPAIGPHVVMWTRLD